MTQNKEFPEFRVEDYIINPPDKANFEIEMGENSALRFAFNEKKTYLKRIQWWLFTRFFPLKIIRWED